MNSILSLLSSVICFSMAVDGPFLLYRSMQREYCCRNSEILGKWYPKLLNELTSICTK